MFCPVGSSQLNSPQNYAQSGESKAAIMSRKTTIDTLFVKRADPGSAGISSDKDRVRTGAISAMGTSLKELTEGAKAAVRLREQISAGDTVVELDPGLLDSSMVADRLLVEIDPSFDALVESIRTSGQQVPILVRPHPTSAGRYQVAFGHRRMRAAARIGIGVRAVVRSLTDSELVIAQGKENLDRRDLSYIEKALFARRLEDQGFDRSVILAALSTDKGDLSRYIAVARMIPEALLHSIGPAMKAGRARWTALAERLKQARSQKIVDQTLESPAFQTRDSDGRFSLLFDALTKATRSKEPLTKTWLDRNGQKAARIEFRSDRTVVTIDDGRVPDFGSFLVDRLDDLYAQFLSTKGKEAGNLQKP